MNQLLTLSMLAAMALPAVAQYKKAEEKLDKLIAQLKDADVKVRMRAAISIGNLGAAVKKRAIPALRDVLLDSKENFNVHNHAAVAIQKMGIDARPILIQCAKEGPTFVRRVSTEALGGMGAAAVPTLIQALKDPDRHVRRIAIRSLGRIGPAAKSSVPALEAATRDANEYVATTAARTLWRIATGGKSQESSFAHGKTDRGLAAFLRSPQKTFQVGEPILLTYGLIFHGSGDQLSTRVWRPLIAVDPNNGSWFEVTGPTGKQLKYRGMFVSWAVPEASEENTTSLRTREFIGRNDSDLTLAYNLTQPGTYTVRWFYQPFGGGGGAWTGKLKSNEVKVTIVKLRAGNSAKKSPKQPHRPN